MKKIRMALGTLGVLALAGCSTLQVRTDYDPQASFTELRTYSWVGQSNAASDDPALAGAFVRRRIELAVDSTLRRVGYRRSATDADFHVTYRIVADRGSRTDPAYGYYGFGSSYGFGPRFGYGRYFGRGFGYDLFVSPSVVREYVEATLVLDITDARTNELVWRGWATRRLNRNPSPQAVQDYVRDAVTKILEEFPPSSLDAQGVPVAP